MGLVRLSVSILPVQYCFLNRYSKVAGYRSVSELVRKLVDDFYDKEAMAKLADEEDD